MRKTLIALILHVLVVPGACAAATLELHEVATAAGELIRVADVADVHCSNEMEKATIENTFLGASPAKQGLDFVIIDREKIRVALSLQGFDSDSLEFTGASQTAVRNSADGHEVESNPDALNRLADAPSGMDWNRTVVNNAVRKQLAVALNVDETGMELEMTSLSIESQKILKGKIEVISVALINADSVKADLKGFFKIEAFVELLHAPNSTSVVERAIPKFSFRIALFTQALVAAENLPKDAILEAQHLKLMRVQAAPGTNYITDASKLVGLQTVRAINTGTPITATALKQIPDVRRNQTVLFVTSFSKERGVAQNDGAIGDEITLKLQRGGQTTTVRAIITGPGITEPVQ